MESVCYLLNNSIGQPIAILQVIHCLFGDVGRPDLMSGNKMQLNCQRIYITLLTILLNHCLMSL